MKIRTHPRKRLRAGALIAVLLLALIIAGTLASYLLMLEGERNQVARAQAWNNAMVLTEAGIEEGMAMINVNGATAGDVTTWANSAVTNGWSSPTANVYRMQRYIGSNYYTVYITNITTGGNYQAVIKSTGTVAWNCGFGSSTISRAVLVTNSAGSFMGGGILVKKGITLSGGVVVDGFNSLDPLLSTNGQYIVSKRNSGASIATLESNVVAAIGASGSADIYGKAYTGPGSTITTTGTSAIGDTNWIAAGNTGVEANWSFNDLNISIPDAPATPTWTGATQTMPSIIHNSTTNTLVSSGPGTTNIYTSVSAITINNITTLLITNAPGKAAGGVVVLNVPSLATGNSGAVTIAPNITFVLNTTATPGLNLAGNFGITNDPNSALILNAPGGTTVGNGTAIGLGKNANFVAYLGGSSSIGGAGWVNNGNATNVTVYGSTTCTNITISNGGSLIGTIYAPEAAIAVTGGADMAGSLVGYSVNVANGFQMHYDESLPGLTSLAAYTVNAWAEVSP